MHPGGWLAKIFSGRFVFLKDRFKFLLCHLFIRKTMQFIRGGIGSIPKCLFIDLLAGTGNGEGISPSATIDLFAKHHNTFGRAFTGCSICLWWSEYRKCCRFNEFGVDGGPAAKDLAPKFNVFKKNLSVKLGVTILEIDVQCSFHKLDIFVVTSESYLQVDFWWCIGKVRVREIDALLFQINHKTAHCPDGGSGNPKRSACNCSPVFGPGREDKYDLTGLTDVRPPNPNASM
ncbi:hypothetical protein D8674_005977 [Pyrus ussuriensis x Pyrus communis]|uniref:Uncharacterized protein n=1 Tax=Pyrus ussuriensis x Pyrus communis TaxID=2448454 RepID=A0A5N5FY01_9ROSA|nr:hypothetical protein D8674_005977 [Pyrus ussuriensis x Pyrus communis]